MFVSFSLLHPNCSLIAHVAGSLGPKTSLNCSRTRSLANSRLSRSSACAAFLTNTTQFRVHSHRVRWNRGGAGSWSCPGTRRRADGSRGDASPSPEPAPEPTPGNAGPRPGPEGPGPVPLSLSTGFCWSAELLSQKTGTEKSHSSSRKFFTNWLVGSKPMKFHSSLPYSRPKRILRETRTRNSRATTRPTGLFAIPFTKALFCY